MTTRRSARGFSDGASPRHLPTSGVYQDLYNDVDALNERLDTFLALPRVTMSQVQAAINEAIGDVDARIRAIVAELDLVTREQVIQMIEDYMASHTGITASQVQEMIDTAVSDALNTAY